MKLKHICLFIFGFVWLTHFLSKTVTITDSYYVLPLSMSIIREHDVKLDECKALIETKRFPMMDTVQNHLYAHLPAGTSILIAPVLKLLDLTAAKVFYMDMGNTIRTGYGGGIELFLASFLVALTSVFIFLIAFEISKGKWISLATVFVFAYCTGAWSTASRGLWSHTSSILMLSIALFALLRAKNNANWLLAAGLALGYAYFCRPTNSLAIIFFSLYVLYTHNRKSPVYFVGLFSVLGVFCFYNYHIYRHLLSPYYEPSHLNVGGNSYLWEALAGNLICPSRGILIFSPVLIFSLAGVIVLIKQKRFTALDVAVGLIILAHYYVISSISTPYAGWSFGPRYMTDMIPFLIYFLVFFLQYLIEMRTGALKYSLGILLLLTTSVSLFINYKGATHPDTFFKWNGEPDITEHPEKYWDWNDLQFMR